MLESKHRSDVGHEKISIYFPFICVRGIEGRWWFVQLITNTANISEFYIQFLNHKIISTKYYCFVDSQHIEEQQPTQKTWPGPQRLPLMSKHRTRGSKRQSSEEWNEW